MQEKVAEILLNIGAVEFRPNDPFTWASGIQSPFYCDNRKIIGDIDSRREIKRYLAETIQELYPEVEVIAGTSTAGIPHAAFVSEALNLPMCYVRGSKKKHGKGKQVEGSDVKSKRVVLIEDLISTGGSSLEAVEGLENEGANVLGVIGIFTYNLQKSKSAFLEKNVKLNTLSNIETLLNVSEQRGNITSQDKEKVEQFLKEL